MLRTPVFACLLSRPLDGGGSGWGWGGGWARSFLLGGVLALLGLGSPGAASSAFYAAAGKIDITPDLKRHKVLLAGFGSKGRKVERIHDPLHARGFVVSDGTHTLGLISVEVLGLYREEVERIRHAALGDPSRESLLIAATHTHAGPDTVGLWGRFVGASGVDPDYQAFLRERVAQLYKDLLQRLEEAEVRAGSKILDPKGLVRDLRDPRVIDAELRVLHFRSTGGRPIGTLVNWSCHAEALGRTNQALSADFPGVLCSDLERDLGECAFFPGSIGGMQTPDRARGGLEVQFQELERIGRALAGEVREVVAGAQGLTPSGVSFVSKVVRVPVENARYLLFLPRLTFGHKLYTSDGKPMGGFRAHLLRLRHLIRPLGPGGFPLTETEVSLARLGPIEILGLPGELFPELYLGGYDGAYRYGAPLISPDNPNPPELSKAPRGPYLRDAMRGRYKFLFGLANDLVGYILPEYDFRVTPGRSMLPKPPGHHYEETNSIGREASRLIVQAAHELLGEK